MDFTLGRVMNEKDKLETRRINYLDGLRGFAALVVLVGHSWLVFSEPLSKFRWNDGVVALPAMLLKFVGLVANSNSAVCMFFLLSGYVMVDFAQSTSLSFPAQIVRRYARLALPILITSTLAYLLLRFELLRNSESARIFGSWAGLWYQFAPSAPSMVYEAIIGTFAMGSNAYNPNLWTMRPELMGSFYVLLIAAIGGSLRWRTALYICFSAYYIFDYLPLFAAGAMLRDHDLLVRRLSEFRRISIAICAIGLYLCTMPDLLVSPWQRYIYPLPQFSYDNGRNWHSIGATLLLIGVLSSPIVQRPLASSLGRALGRISFTLYLIHVPVLCSLGAWLIVLLSPYGNTTAAAIGLLISFVSCLGIAWMLRPIVDGSAIQLSRQVGKWLDSVMTRSTDWRARYSSAPSTS